MRIGDVVNGRYELLEELTPGPYGSGWTSFKARDSQGNLFVVKEPHIRDENSVERGFDGALLINTKRMQEFSINCDEMVSILDFEGCNDSPFYVRPFVSGDSLREKIHASRSVDGLVGPEHFQWLLNIARVLDQARAQEVFVIPKPENILFGGDGAVLLDFYSDMGPGGLTDFKYVYNSWPYIGHWLPFRGLAIVVFETITGKVPYSYPDDCEFGRVVEISESLLGVSEEVSTLISEAISDCDRFESNLSFAEQFLDAVERHPIKLETDFAEQDEEPVAGIGNKTTSPERVSKKRKPYGLEGVLLDDRYRMSEKVGDFGMASLWRAHDMRLQQDVAVKIPHDRPELIERFAVEAKIWRKVAPGNQCIAPITDVGLHDCVPWLVTPWLSGGTLYDWKSSGGNTGTSLEMFDWLTEIAKSLDQIHAAGFCHRDVKPSNIMFDEYGKSHLIDFGISSHLNGRQEVDEGTDEYGLYEQGVGTLLFLAPEILKGEVNGTEKSDQYGLAVTLFEWLVGRKPFTATSPFDLFKQLQDGAPSLSELVAGCPESVAEVVGRALNAEPDKRFESCIEFADAFLSALKSAPDTVDIICQHIMKTPSSQRKLVSQYDRPEAWFCTYCGSDRSDKADEGWCNSCHKSRVFVGGSMTVVVCSSCQEMVAAGSDFCEWCGGSFKTNY